jgi:hypothetical protein
MQHQRERHTHRDTQRDTQREVSLKDEAFEEEQLQAIGRNACNEGW